MKKRKTIFLAALILTLTTALYGQNADDFEVKGTTLVKYRGTATEVVIPGNLGIKEIGRVAFSWSYIRTVTIPNGVTSIGDHAFYNCRSLTGITIPDSVTSIGSHAFENCTSLTSIPIPNSVTSIGGYAFEDCTSLASITIPNSVTNIESSAFNGCTSLLTINVTAPTNNRYTVQDGVLYDRLERILHTYPAGKTGDFTIPNGVKKIGDDAFYNCTRLTGITIPNSVTSIGRYAFYRCTSLTSVSIPNSVTSIGRYAFEDCTSLASVTIPNSVTSVHTPLLPIAL